LGMCAGSQMSHEKTFVDGLLLLLIHNIYCNNNNNNDNNLNNNNTNNNSNNNKYFYIYNILCLVKFLYCQWLGQTFPTHPDIIFLANWLQVPLQ
jgi:hypothetical protein